MKNIIWLIVFLVLVGCKGFVSFRDTHPELNRSFDWRTDEPGQYPFCRNYNEEFWINYHMLGY
jgi:hypothetical protein